MTTDDDFAAALARHLDSDPELPDGTFTRGVIARIERHHRRRRAALAVALAMAAVMAGALASASPDPGPAAPTISSAAIVAVMILAALCSAAWLGTEL